MKFVFIFLVLLLALPLLNCLDEKSNKLTIESTVMLINSNGVPLVELIL